MYPTSNFWMGSGQVPDRAGVQSNDPFPRGRFACGRQFGGESHPREDVGGAQGRAIKRVIGVV
jgi:hypothetical protein